MTKRPDLDRPLHVLVATPAGLAGQGGIDRIMSTLRAELARQARDDISVRFRASRGSGSVLLSVFYMLGFCFEMTVAHLFRRCDIVHINLSSFGSTYRKMIIARWARLLGIAYVLHLHGAEYQTFWTANESLLATHIRAMFENAGGIVVLGRVWADFVAKQAPASAGRILIIPNAAAAPSTKHVGGGDKVHILFLGRVGKRKGVPQLIAALEHMRDLPGWRATIAGDGEVEEARAEISRLGLADRVEIPGWVGADDVANLIATADILTLPSFAENLPVSVIEGMAAGLAVVTTPVGAVSDIVRNGESGLLIEPGDVEALSAALTTLTKDEHLRKKLGEAAQQVHREKLDSEPFAAALINCWKSASQGISPAVAAHEDDEAAGIPPSHRQTAQSWNLREHDS
ncbi:MULTISPECIES: glycosyltransferase family 4 protein [unclassified Sinorhizobium]|uniref:glycosyltransferase family 4 protein n=1 Tax=unclassified Sinorhizobium TaxID=2613772 RepID=UPI0035269260